MVAMLLRFSSSFPSHDFTTLGSANSVNSETTAFVVFPQLLDTLVFFPVYFFFLFFSVYKNSSCINDINFLTFISVYFSIYFPFIEVL